MYSLSVSLMSAEGAQSSFLPLPCAAMRGQLATLPGTKRLNNVSASPNGSQRIKLIHFSLCDRTTGHNRCSTMLNLAVDFGDSRIYVFHCKEPRRKFRPDCAFRPQPPRHAVSYGQSPMEREDNLVKYACQPAQGRRAMRLT